MGNYPVTWREIAEMWHDWALERKNSIRIMRKADFRPSSGEGAAPTPILSLEGSRRSCFSATPFPVRFGAFAIDEDGSVWAWGDNSNNRWGEPLDENDSYEHDAYFSPYRLAVSGTQVSATEFATDVLQGDGSVLTSSTGVDSVGNRGAPFINLSGVTGVTQLDSNQYQTDVGAHYYLQDDGTVYGRGRGLPGEGTTARSTPIQFSTSKTGTDVVEIGASVSRLAFRRASGAVKVWQGGGSFSEPDPQEPTGLPSGVTKLSGGASHTAVLTDSGEVWVSGDNDNGQYGNGTQFIGGTLASWHQTEGADYTDLASAGDNLAAIKDGSLWTWGGSAPLLGLGETPNLTDKLTPQEVTFPAYSDYVSVHGQAQSSVFIAVRESGCMMIWGGNGEGPVFGGYLGRGYSGGVADQPEEVLVSKAYPPWPAA